MYLLWSINSLVIPDYNVVEQAPELTLAHKDEIIREDSMVKIGVEYDINRVSSRNARKSELGPYKNSFLREIIMSHNMGKSTGTKEELVNTILNFHENKSR